MEKTIGQFEISIFNEIDGSKFSKLKDKLIKVYSGTDREAVINVLIKYVQEGRLLHWRNFLLTDIIELVRKNEGQYAGFFEWAVTKAELAYWSIDGLLKTKGKDAYGKLIDLITDKSFSTETRAKAMKSLAMYSNQTFDRDLPGDPGYWKIQDLRINELMDWMKGGFKDGTGYLEPEIHPSLHNPKTELEKIVAKLNKKLEAEREKQQDLSNPTNWLAIAEKDKIAEIEHKWQLPEDYLLFLKYYSPIKVFIDNRNFFQGLWLYGADDLIKNQAGYSYNAITGEIADDWPENFVVIADAGSDPYCIDINSNDGAIFTSIHGMGEWEFEKYSDSFIDFLKEL